MALAVALVTVHLAPRHRGAWPIVTRALAPGGRRARAPPLGHVGDYVAWLLLGVAAIGAAVLVPVRG